MNRLTQLFRAVPTECWALLLIVLPVIAVACNRLDLIEAHRALKTPGDPDSWLRLTLVREWLNGAGWYDHDVPRTNTPLGGITTPWTRPLDLVLGFLTQIQFHGDVTIRLLRAAAILPAIWTVLLVLGMLQIARQLGKPGFMPFLSVVMLGATPILWGYFGEGNADHHAPLAVLWTWAVALNLDPQARHTRTQGLLLAIMLWISPEALLPIAVLYGWRALDWLCRGGDLTPLARLSGWTAFGSLLALMIERPSDQWLTPLYDTISIAHVALLLLCALAAHALALLNNPSLGRRILTAIASAALVLVGMALLYPRFFLGPMADADPYILTDFLPNINEAKPLYSKRPLFVISVLFVPVLALGAALAQLRRLSPAMRQMLFVLVATLALVMLQLRWVYYLVPVAAVMLAALLAPLYDDTAPSWNRLALRMALLVTILAGPLVLLSINPSKPGPVRRADQCEKTARVIIHSGALTRALGDKPLALYAPTDVGADILFFTPYSIVASNYHREGPGIRYVWKAKRIDSEEALRKHFAERGLKAALICPDTHFSKRSVLKRWLDGGIQPAWVQWIPLRGRNAPLLLRIR